MQKSARRRFLERLTSPEKLDRLLVVIGLPGWIALALILFVILILLGWAIWGRIPVTVDGKGILFNPRGVVLVQADKAGFVEKISAHAGQEVEKGAELAKVQLLDGQGEKVVEARAAGVVLNVDVLLGEEVVPGSTLFWLEEAQGGPRKIYAFFPLDVGQKIREGMEALVAFGGVDQELYGKVQGKVVHIMAFTASDEAEVLRSIPSKEIRSFLTDGSLAIAVEILPKEDPTTVSGFAWTSEQGPPFPVHLGSLAQVEVVLEEKRPIRYLIP